MITFNFTPIVAIHATRKGSYIFLTLFGLEIRFGDIIKQTVQTQFIGVGRGGPGVGGQAPQ